MKGKGLKKLMALGLTAAMTATVFAGCGGGGKSSKVDDEHHFTEWIYQDDGAGTYYSDYADAPAVQYVNQQYWDASTGGIGTEESGTQIRLDFIVPVAGGEVDNFNTMISTGDYPEIIDLTVSSENAQALVEEGILMDITEYVEKYMPNYVNYIEEHPELKAGTQTVDENGKIHYYSLHRLADSPRPAWQGYMYRRDWLVAYATPSEYVWDWDSDYVKANGHPAVTPMADAVKQNDLEGWKKNEVTSFSADEGADPDEDYTDNVIFPSGKSDPITISDWEWMFEAFDKAIADRGWADDSGSYGISISYMGNSALGDIVSSFGGGTGFVSNLDGKAVFDTTSDTMAAYTECMQNWYKKGWLDQAFNERTDLFYMINTTGVSQGRVGMWSAYTGNSIGDVCRETCLDERDQKSYFAMPCQLPLNDMYGSDAQKFVEPNALYQDSRIETNIGITTKCEGKDLEALFTFFNWAYSLEGSETLGKGLTKEQIASVELNPNCHPSNYTELQPSD